jgi:hypothetical protein
MNTENLKLCDRRIPFLHRQRLAEMDGCSMGVIRRGWLGVTSAKALTPAWTICYQH